MLRPLRGFRRRSLPRRQRHLVPRRLDRRPALRRAARCRSHRGRRRKRPTPRSLLTIWSARPATSTAARRGRQHRTDSEPALTALRRRGVGHHHCGGSPVARPSTRTVGRRTRRDHVDAATIKVVLGGLAHAEDLLRISRLAGEVDEQTQTRTRGVNEKSVATSVRRLPALPVEKLRGLPVGRALVLARRAHPVEAAMTPHWLTSKSRQTSTRQT